MTVLFVSFCSQLTVSFNENKDTSYLWPPDELGLITSKSTSLLTEKYCSSSSRDFVWHCCYYWWLVVMILELWDNTAAQIDALIDLALFWVICGVSAACLGRQNSHLEVQSSQNRGGTIAESGWRFMNLLLSQQLFDAQESFPSSCWDLSRNRQDTGRYCGSRWLPARFRHSGAAYGHSATTYSDSPSRLNGQGRWSMLVARCWWIGWS